MVDNIWEVVGGIGKDGILVRMGRDLTSPTHPCRLGTGARVRELGLYGVRLHFKLVTGVGPDTGWVTTRLEQKELLVCLPVTPAEAYRTWTAEANRTSQDSCAGDSDGVASVPTAIWDLPRQRVRKQFLCGWAMQVRGEYVSPPMQLGADGTNPIHALGECADPNCGNYRPRAPKVRTAFAEFCIGQIAAALPKSSELPIAYVSVGSGALFFDWELLERLRESIGVRVARITLIDTLYAQPDARIRQALEQFEAWFAGAIIKRYTSASQFLKAEVGTQVPAVGARTSAMGLSERAEKRCLSRGLYQVLMQCDAAQVDEEKGTMDTLRSRALQPGGVAFCLSNPSERFFWQRRADGSGVDFLDNAVWQYPGWQQTTGPGTVQPMLTQHCSEWITSCAELRRRGIHGERLAVLREEHPNCKEPEVPEDATNWSDEVLTSLFGSGGA